MTSRIWGNKGGAHWGGPYCLLRDFHLSKIEPDMIAAGQYIVGTLIHAGIVTADKAELAVQIVAEELQVWLAIRDVDNAKPN